MHTPRLFCGDYSMFLNIFWSFCKWFFLIPNSVLYKFLPQIYQLQTVFVLDLKSIPEPSHIWHLHNSQLVIKLSI